MKKKRCVLSLCRKHVLYINEERDIYNSANALLIPKQHREYLEKKKWLCTGSQYKIDVDKNFMRQFRPETTNTRPGFRPAYQVWIGMAIVNGGAQSCQADMQTSYPMASVEGRSVEQGILVCATSRNRCDSNRIWFCGLPSCSFFTSEAPSYSPHGS